jgi:Rrf2 family protein
MLRLSKKVEYGILAMQYMASNPNNLFTAKSISDNLHISYDFLAKTMQKLMKGQLIDSQQGIKGGYILAKPAEEIKLMDIIEVFDSRPELVDCVSGNRNCFKMGSCQLQDPIRILQRKVEDIFSETSLQDISEQHFVKLEVENHRG